MSTKPPAVSKENATLLRDLTKVCEALELRYPQRKVAKPSDFIEALVYQILELGTSEKAARDALRRLREEYTDWNDARVATVREIEDILGARYYLVREKAEDIRHLLADIYTAFRTMALGSQLTPEGVETLLALPVTTNVRKDMVERALVLCHEIRLFPCDDDQFGLIKFLAPGLFKDDVELPQAQRRIEEALDIDLMLRLSRGLREHVHVYQAAGESEPQMIGFGWDQPDPLKMDKAKKPVTAKIEKAEKPEKTEKPAPKVEVEKAEKVEKPVTAKIEKAEKPVTAKIEKPVEKPTAKVEKKTEKPAAKAEKPAAKTEKKPELKKAEAKDVKKAAKKPEPKKAEAKKPEPKKAEAKKPAAKKK